MPRKPHFLTIALVAASLFCLAGSAGAEGLNIKLTPNLVNIGPFFGGVALSLSGTAPQDSQVAVVMEGPLSNLEFKEKRLTLGVFWMNQGRVVFRGIPSVYMVYTSPGLAEASPGAAKFGYEAVEREVNITPEAEEKFLFKEFVKLKEEDGLYAQEKGAVQLGEANKGERPFKVKLMIAPKMPKGEYAVRVMALDGRRVLASDTEHLKVQESGILRHLSNLAKNYGLLYGIVAVLIAIGAGLLMDVLFGAKKTMH